MDYLRNGLRFDDRKLDEYRKISIEYGISKNAEGSAHVKVGETEVLAGVKMEIGTPFPDKPGEGSIMVNAELLPLSSPTFEAGPPGIQAVELARVVDRGIRESKALDFKKLCVKEGEKVWMLMIDIITINDAGNLFDASALAAVAALKDAYFPELTDDKIDYHKKTDKSVPLEKLPMSVTVYKIGDKYLIDPSTDEEEFVDARLTVCTLEDGTLCAMQKGKEGALTLEEIDEMVSIAIRKGHELRELVK